MLRLLLATIVVFCAGAAHAANITLLRPGGSSPELAEALYRIQGELMALGLEVELAERPRSDTEAAIDSRAGLERMARERGIDAVIDVVGKTTPTAVDIWIFERSPQRSTVSRVTLEPNAPNKAETLAIRAIEVLRSNFLEIDLAARARLGERVTVPQAPPERDSAPKQVRPRAEHVGLQAGASVLTSLDGVGPAIMPLVRVDWALQSWLVAQATFSGFGTRPSVETATGSARVAQQYAVVGLCYCLTSDPGIRPFLGFAAGALHTSLEGHAVPPEQGHDVQRWSFLVEGSVGARLRFSGPYYLTFAAHVQLAEPYVGIYFVDELIASSGRPNLLFALTLGAWL